ncbi:hypothetical protein D3C81_2188370 [compost metagenome]
MGDFGARSVGNRWDAGVWRVREGRGLLPASAVVSSEDDVIRADSAAGSRAHGDFDQMAYSARAWRGYRGGTGEIVCAHQSC